MLYIAIFFLLLSYFFIILYIRLLNLQIAI